MLAVGSPGVGVSTEGGACMVPYRGECVGLRVVDLGDWLFELGQLACCSTVSLALRQIVESPLLLGVSRACSVN